MTKARAKRIGVIAGACVFLAAAVAFVPGLEFRGEIPGVIGVDKRSSKGGQKFSLSVGKWVAKYELAYHASGYDPCWGREGFSMKCSGYPYFRWGTFELYAWRNP
jgi:hypothetical protein